MATRHQSPDLPFWMTNTLENQGGAAQEMNSRFGPQDGVEFENQTRSQGFVPMPRANSPGFHSPSSGYQPASGMQGINSQGQVGQYEDPSAGDRVQRALKGALKGPDTGSKVGNRALGVGASLMGPAGIAGRSAAGAIQGAKDSSPVFNTGTPATTDPTRPTALGNLPQGLDSVSPGGKSTSMPSPGGLFDEATPRSRPQSGGGSGTTGVPTSGASPGPWKAGYQPFYGPGETQPTGDEALLGQDPVPPASGSQFTGGSGKPVDPYQLPEEEALAKYLTGGQSYGSYDASSGRVGTAASGINGYAAHGFDFGQDPGNRDIGKSAKYAFAHFANQAAQAGKPMPRNHEEAASWFNENILPGFTELGYTVNWVTGDKAEINTREGTYVVDFLSDSGGSNPQLWWGADTPEQAALNASLGSAGGGSGGGMGEFESRMGQLGVADTGNPALDSYAQQIVNMLLEREALDGAMADGGGQYQRRYDRLRSFA